MSETVNNPPYVPPKGGADVAPPVPPENSVDPKVKAYIDSTQLPPDPCQHKAPAHAKPQPKAKEAH